ncbi:MAG: carbamate kinase [Alphaproteobacteria bacterium]
MLIVAALGGNALLRRGQPLDIPTQRHNAYDAARAVAPIIAAHEVIITHGNGPQIGLLALQTAPGEDAYPLDVLGAECEGMIGYLLEQEFAGILPDRQFATILTLVEVAADDPAFARPTKPIGPVYALSEWSAQATRHGWTGVADGDGIRRAVPSPLPQRIIQTDVIALLLRHGITPICAGGGGVPVVRRADGRLEGVEAVIDKDFTAARLAVEVGADLLLLLTDVDAIYADWPTPAEQPISEIAANDLQALNLAAGSMGPKAAAAAWFCQATGRHAVIGCLAAAAQLLDGKDGTRVLPTAGRP